MPERKDLTVETMKSEINRMAKDLGMPEVKFDADRALSAYGRGKPLTLGELRALPENAVVFVWYKEHGEEGPRINHPMRASKMPDEDTWGLEDGSSFAAEFTPTGDYDHEAGTFAVPSDATECFDEGGGEGEMRLYHAVPRPKATPKPKKGRSRR